MRAQHRIETGIAQARGRAKEARAAPRHPAQMLSCARAISASMARGPSNEKVCRWRMGVVFDRVTAAGTISRSDSG